MKYLIIGIAATLLFACNTYKNVAESTDVTPEIIKEKSTELENSVLWKIEHETLSEASYLYGTIHILCKTDNPVPEKVITALNEVDELILEIDFADMNEISSLQSIMAQTKPISEQISEEEFKKLDEKFNQITGIPLSAVDQMGFLGITQLLITKSLDCDEQSSLEIELMKQAINNKQNIDGLETVADQFEALEKSMDIEEQLRSIYEFEEGKQMLQKAVNVYLTEEDIEETVDLLFDEEQMSAVAIEELLINRNNNWMKIIPKSIAEESALIAVGTGHLVDEYGIINQLRVLGYKVTPVY